jgi:hypothetical protein
MRFLRVPGGSRIEELAHQYAQKTRVNRKYAWTKGQYGVLFEVRCYPLRPQEEGQDVPDAYGWNLFLVIGPTEDIDRTAFVTRLRGLLVQAFPDGEGERPGSSLPVVRQGMISPIFLSALKWKLAATNVEALERELLAPQLIASLQQVARLVEQAWTDPEIAV